VGQEPDRIRAEIEQTRAAMSETVDALGHKADVKTRAKENLQDKKASAKESIVGMKDKVVGGTPDAGTVKAKALRGASVAQENPLGLALGAVALGFVGGLLIPSTRVEDEKLGPMAAQVKHKVKESGEEAVERGKEVAQQAAQSAKETAQQAGREQAEGLKDSTQQKVQATRDQAG
jgi:hypothetical protein